MTTDRKTATVILAGTDLAAGTYCNIIDAPENQTCPRLPPIRC